MWLFCYGGVNVRETPHSDIECWLEKQAMWRSSFTKPMNLKTYLQRNLNINWWKGILAKNSWVKVKITLPFRFNPEIFLQGVYHRVQIKHAVQQLFKAFGTTERVSYRTVTCNVRGWIFQEKRKLCWTFFTMFVDICYVSSNVTACVGAVESASDGWMASGRNCHGNLRERVSEAVSRSPIKNRVWVM